MKNKTPLEIEKEFKEYFGFSMRSAEEKIRSLKSDSEELYHLRCLLNGFDVSNASKPILDQDDINNIRSRIDQLNKY